MPKFYYIERLRKTPEGRIESYGSVDIPERDLEGTLANNPLWRITGSIDTSIPYVAEQPFIEPPVVDASLSCPLCGKEAKNQRALKIHKGKMHQ